MPGFSDRLSYFFLITIIYKCFLLYKMHMVCCSCILIVEKTIWWNDMILLWEGG